MWIEIEYQGKPKLVNLHYVTDIKPHDRRRRDFSEPASLEGERGKEYFDDTNEYWNQIFYFIDMVKANGNVESVEYDNKQKRDVMYRYLASKLVESIIPSFDEHPPF